MISEDLEIDLQSSSNNNSDHNFDENKKTTLTQHQIHVSTKIKRGRPPKQQKKARKQKAQSLEERKCDESPDIIMIGSSKAKMAKANTIMKKIKKKFTSEKQHQKQVSEGIKKVKKQLKATKNKTQQKLQSVVQSFKKFLKELKNNMQKALQEGDKILKEIE